LEESGQRDEAIQLKMEASQKFEKFKLLSAAESVQIETYDDLVPFWAQ
jgi:hypothetical protein